MGKVITPESGANKRPKRPKRPKASSDAGFQSDLTWDIPDITHGEPPAERSSPKAARRVRLTEEVVAALDPEPRQYYVWDIRRKGLGVRIGASGAVSYVLKVNLPGKRSIWKTLESKTLDEAGIEYHELLSKFGKGEPLPKRQVGKLWQDVVDRYLAEEVPLLKPKTQATYKSALKLVRAGFMNRLVRSLVMEDIRDFHRRMNDRPRQANVCVGLCRIILDRCEAWKDKGGTTTYRDLNTNPVDILRKSNWSPYPENSRNRLLTDDEYISLGEALSQMENKLGKDGNPLESPYTIAAVRLLLFTGKRLREILDLKWDQIDLVNRNIHWDDTKTGVLDAPLNDAALEVLQGLERMTYMNNQGKVVENPYVLPGSLEGEPIRDITKFWNRMLKLAGITDLTRHDMRHAHGNEVNDLNLPEQVAQALLGHKSIQTTGRYFDRGKGKSLADSQVVSGSLKAKLGRKR